MAVSRVFTSFDYDRDDDLRVLFVGQSKHKDSPFDFVSLTYVSDKEDSKAIDASQALIHAKAAE